TRGAWRGIRRVVHASGRIRPPHWTASYGYVRHGAAKRSADGGMRVADPRRGTKRSATRRRVMAFHVKRFGWVPDLPDARDHQYAAPLRALRTLPARFDLTGHCPPVYDQGDLGSCTGNAIAGAIEFLERKEKRPHPATPSRLFIYYNERVIEHTVPIDNGAMIRDGIKTVNKQGACRETTWPYDISKFATKPSVGAYEE